MELVGRADVSRRQCCDSHDPTSKPRYIEGGIAQIQMINLFSFLKCPETDSKLSHADAGLVARLNQGIACGAITNRLGQSVSLSIEKGLVNDTKTLFFLVVDEIPQMVLDEAISLDQLIAEPKGE